jgi:hypothetical protein
VADDSRWAPVVETLRDHGFDAELQVGFMGMRVIRVELGDGWQASVATGTGSLDDFSPAEPIQVSLFGPDVPGEAYSVQWWPETTDIRRLAAAVMPLLRRVSTTAGAQADVEPPASLDLVTADPALRDLLRAVGSEAVLHPALLWRLFSSFALRPVDGVSPQRDQDLVLFETTSRREIHLMRQFDAGEAMEQLSCTLQVDSDLPPATILGRAGSDAINWIAEVEASEAYKRGLATSGIRFDFASSAV